MTQHATLMGLVILLLGSGCAGIDDQAPPRRSSTSLDPRGVAQLLESVDEGQLGATIERLVNLGSRCAVVAAAALAAQNEALRLLQTIQTAYPDRRIQILQQPFTFTWDGTDYSRTNLLLALPGTDPARGLVLLGAHRDTISNISSPEQPGANDNASGVAAILEIARLLAQDPRPETVVIALFDAEEAGRWGSRALVQDGLAFLRSPTLWPEGAPFLGMLNLDTLGKPCSAGFCAHRRFRLFSAGPASSRSRRLAQQVALAGQIFLPELEASVEPTRDRPSRWGDHQSFSDEGLAAVRLMQRAEDSTAHHPTDTATGIDLAYLRRGTQLALAATLALTDLAAPPPESCWRVHGADVLNLRNGPGLGHAVLAQLPEETPLTALAPTPQAADTPGDTNAWLAVSVLGVAGWVAADFVTPCS